MKNILIIAVLISAAFLYFTNRDDLAQSVSFNGAEFKLAKVEGEKEALKIYKYTKSGRFLNLDDYVEIIIVNKAGEMRGDVEKIYGLLRKARKLSPVTGSEGEFGVFYASPDTREYYAYYVFKETADAYWLVNFVIASNLGKNAISTNEAKNRAGNYINELENIFTTISL